MTKQELRDGDRLTLRNGRKEFFDNLTEDWKNDLNDDLTDIENSKYDIVKVERIQVDYEELNNNPLHKINPQVDSPGSYADDIEKWVNASLAYKKIWEREEPSIFQQNYEDVREYTLKGCRVDKEAILHIVKQPKKIEPLKIWKGEEDKIICKINEIVEVINNGR